MRGVEATARFAELVSGPDAAIPLDEAALCVAAVSEPDLDVDAVLRRIDALAAGCPVPTLDGLILHLFGVEGFRGAADYTDPANSHLNRVLETRRGIPIALCVLTMEVGRRIGVPLAGVSMPGHFLLRDKVDPTVFVDPYHGGVVLDRAGVERLFRSVNGPGSAPTDAMLAPVGKRLILARMLNNLRVIHARRGDLDALCRVMGLLVRLPEATVEDRRRHVALLARTGRFDVAAEELERMARAGLGAPGELSRRALEMRARLN